MLRQSREYRNQEGDLSNISLGNMGYDGEPGAGSGTPPNPDAAAEAAKADELAKAKAVEGQQTPEQIAAAAAEAERVAAELAKTQVELDGQTFKLDAEGNATNDKGEIVKTKDELAAIKAHNESAVQNYIKTIGFQFEDENGKPKEYEDSENGFIEYNKDVAQYLAEQEFEKKIGSVPTLKRYFEALAAGMSEKDYFEKIVNNDLSGVELTKDTPESDKLNFVVRALTLQGMDANEAKSIADLYKDKGILDDKAKAAVATLNAHKDNTEKANKESIIQREKQAEEKRTNYWNGVKETVLTKGKLDNVTIPVADRVAFFNYLAVPVNEQGQSQEMIDRMQAPLEVTLKDAFYRFKKYDVSSIVRDTVNNQKVQTMTDKLRNNSNKQLITGVSPQNTNQGKLNPSDLTLKNLLENYNN